MELKALTVTQAERLKFEISCGWESLKTINGENEEE